MVNDFNASDILTPLKLWIKAIRSASPNGSVFNRGAPTLLKNVLLMLGSPESGSKVKKKLLKLHQRSAYIDTLLCIYLCFK